MKMLSKIFFLVGVVTGIWLSALTAFASGIVTNCNEAELRAAMSGGGLVTFACSGTITVGTIVVSNNTILDASGQNVALNLVGGHFYVGTGITFTAKQLVLSNGYARLPFVPPVPPPEAVFGGGAIFNELGTVNLIQCTLSGNQAAGYAIFPNFSEVIWPGWGGAIFNHGILNATNTIFARNIVTGQSGEPFGTPSLGGAVYSSNGVVNLVDCVFTNNRAVGGNGISNSITRPGYGGAGYGGAVYAYGGSLYCSNVLFEANEARGGVRATNDSRSNGGGNEGGAIYTSGILTAINCLFRSNVATNGCCGAGGAIVCQGPLALDGCTLAENRVRGAGGHSNPGYYLPPGNARGAGIFSSGSLNITNTTITDNIAQGGYMFTASLFDLGGEASGGIFFQGKIGALQNVTIVSNRAFGGFQGLDGSNPDPNPGSPMTSHGGGIMMSSNALSLTMRGSIAAFNVPGGDGYGPITDGGFNILSDASQPFNAPGSRTNTDPLLGPLQNNGGLTPTMEPLTNSPALDALDLSCPLIDQRGSCRPAGPACDIGAVERRVVRLHVSIQRTNGSVKIVGDGGNPNTTNQLLDSTNFTFWSVAQFGLSDPCGRITFLEPTAGRSRFYRLTSP